MPRLLFLSLAVLFVAASSRTVSAQNEQVAVDAAAKTYDKEVEAARLAYEEALGRANKKLLATYDTSIRTAMRRGGGDGLDTANKLNEDKKKLLSRVEGGDKSPAGTENKVADMLTSKVWYWHWEEANKDNPMKFLPDGGFTDKNGKVQPTKWTLERKWVVTVNDHQFVQVNDNLFRGFFTQNGRQTGIFAEPKK